MLLVIIYSHCVAGLLRLFMVSIFTQDKLNAGQDVIFPVDETTFMKAKLAVLAYAQSISAARAADARKATTAVQTSRTHVVQAADRLNE